MPGKHGYGRAARRDPRAVAAVRPQAVNRLDLEEWDKMRLASEHLPLPSARPAAGKVRRPKDGVADAAGG